MSEKNTTTENRANSGKKNSLLSMISVGVFMLGINAIQIVVIQNYPFFFQTRMQLSITWMFWASVIYTIWDMFNDPIMGNLSDQNYRFTKRWGKRLPWMLFGTIGLVFALILLFSPPLNQIGSNIFLFFWFLIFLSAYDGLLSAITVNYNALIPVKFKSKEERIKVSVFIQLFIILGPAIGLGILPKILTDDPKSYISMSIFLVVFVIISLVLALPGLKESSELKESYFLMEREKIPFFREFIKNLKQALSQKAFLVYAVVTVAITVSLAIINASVPYYVEYVLGIGSSSQPDLYGETLSTLNMPFIITSLFLIPIHFVIVKKLGHIKAFKFSLLLAPIPLMLIFLSLGNMPMVMLGAAIWGFLGGIIVIARTPVAGDFFDESAIKYKLRQEGMYLGLWNFFSRLVTVIELGIFTIIQNVTGFDATASIQSPLAKLGIMTQFGLIPAIILIIAALIFWRYWSITPEIAEINKKKLDELGI
ncbi:MAG: MFS transporter [Candidatus Hodarchaeota archaeon]